jgi:hypothetical protein
MDNLNSTEKNTKQDNEIEQASSKKNTGPLVMFIGAFILVIIALWQFSGGKIEKDPITSDDLIKTEEIVKEVEPEFEPIEVVEDVLPEVEEVVEPIETLEVEKVEEIEPVENILPVLDDSDPWLKEKLPELTWRTELLKLVIDEDMIRRFVVFTDNFSQGNLAYEHSPFTLPGNKFSVDENQVIYDNNQNVWQWNGDSSKRFDLYTDLLRSIDSDNLVNWYFEVKPLIDEAYNELGYEDDFTNTLQEAITRVLDMELPKSSMALIRPSVMYKYQDEKLEALPDSDKLLLRLGKENLLVIKSILLEVNEKLAKKKNGLN